LRGIPLGLGLAWAGALVSVALALVNPHFLSTFWQIPDGLEILHGHMPSTVGYAISSGPLVAQEWLYEAGLAWFVRHGAFGLWVALCAFAAGATPLLAYAVARGLGIGDLASGIAAFLVTGSRLAASAIRPETFAVDALAIELLILATLRRNWLWLVPCVVLWANLHASVVLAPLIALVFAGTRLIERRRDDAEARPMFGTVALTFAATLASPYGLRLWSYAFGLAIAPNPTRANLEVWRALSFDAAGALATVLPGLLILLCYGLVLKRRYAAELVVAALFFILTLMHVRYATFLAVGWAPALARTLAVRAGIRAAAARRLLAPTLALLPLALYAAVQMSAALRAPVDAPGPWQSAAALALECHLRGNAYAPYTWAGYLHWRGVPMRFLIDGHGDPYPADVWNDHIALRELHANWRDVLERRDIGVIIIPLDSPLAQALAGVPEWQRVGLRNGVVAFERRESLTTAR
jgi:hypothetical protein